MRDRMALRCVDGYRAYLGGTVRINDARNPHPHCLKWCQRRDLNPRPKAYESSALPLSYSGDRIHFPANRPAVKWNEFLRIVLVLVHVSLPRSLKGSRRRARTRMTWRVENPRARWTRAGVNQPCLLGKPSECFQHH